MKCVCDIVVSGDLESGAKVHVFKGLKRGKREQREQRGRGRKSVIDSQGTTGHSDCVLALAVSSDGKFLVSSYICTYVRRIYVYQGLVYTYTV